ncbi:MAG: AmmeMemoRadiSam system protein B [Planctomycetota bacterium]
MRPFAIVPPEDLLPRTSPSQPPSTAVTASPKKSSILTGSVVGPARDSTSAIPSSAPAIPANPGTANPGTANPATANPGSARSVAADLARLTTTQREQLRETASRLVAEAIAGRTRPPTSDPFASVGQQTVYGAFVTLKREGRLRACCGALGQPMPLSDAVTQAARYTATQDRRFPPLKLDELPHLSLDLNLLHSFRTMGADRAERLRSVTVGRHGLRIQRGNQAGLLLPSVATEQRWNAETFLQQVGRKAGLPTNAWEDPDTELQTFESLEFGGPLVSAVLMTEQSSTLVTHTDSTPAPHTRPPAVAGTFYPSDSWELRQMSLQLLAKSQRWAEAWPAAMVPHAGLIYSGQLAAAVLNRLEFPQQIIVIGPKHTRLGVPWAVAPHETWSLPGCTVQSDLALAQQLAANIPGLQLDAAAHEREHAIEIELPFLSLLAPQSRVVGLAIGAATYEECREFAAGLARVLQSLQPRPLLLISSDMNHFATDTENRRLDQIALAAMQTLDPQKLFAVVREHNISMCGLIPAVIVMETLRQLGGLTHYEQVGYSTSAEVSGDTSRVVGYAGVLLR